MLSPLLICILCHPDSLTQFLLPLEELLSSETPRYHYQSFDNNDALLQYIEQAGHVDCLIVQATPQLQSFFDRLQAQGYFFPTVVVLPEVSWESEQAERSKQLEQLELSLVYHPAMVSLPIAQLDQLREILDQAIGKFMQLQPDAASAPVLAEPEATVTHKLMTQQLRLAEKLKERLDYLGVYYKRNPQNFLRHMTPPQKQDLLRQLKSDYRAIILAYFSDEPSLNEQIDLFVNLAFFSDVPISQIVEIHMELMDEFSKQLKLEGRSDEVLLDYRLTLIDTLAHLCEMYRRSIPRES